jgi:apolipoprotein N-acyltransferase
MVSKPQGEPGWWLIVAAFAGSTVMLYFGTGLTPIPALTWIAPLPVLLLAPRVSTRTAVAVAFGSYVVSTANSWAYYAHSHDVPLPAGIGISLGYSVTFAVGVLLFRALLRRGQALLAALAVPAVWVALLYLVASVNPTGISGTLAGSQVGVPLVLQTASVAGAWGLEFLIMLVPALIAALPFAVVRLSAVALALSVAVIALGVANLSKQDSRPAQRIALLVHNTAGWGVDIASPSGQALVKEYAAQLSAVPDGIDTIVLPEGAFGVDDASLPQLRDTFAALASARHSDIVVGYIRSSGGRKYNEALALPGTAGQAATYLKHHDTVSVPGQDLVFLPATHIGITICMDVNFPDPARDYATAGATMLVIPAADNNEDGWQHAHTAVLRGVENGLAVAWAARYGTLTVADSRGRILTEQHVGTASTVTMVIASVSTGSGTTFYTRTGDWAAWLSILLTIVFTGLLVVRGRRRTGNPAAGTPQSSMEPQHPTAAGDPAALAR